MTTDAALRLEEYLEWQAAQPAPARAGVGDVCCERTGCTRVAELDIRPAGTIAVRLTCAAHAGPLLLGWPRAVATIEVRQLRA